MIASIINGKKEDHHLRQQEQDNNVINPDRKKKEKRKGELDLSINKIRETEKASKNPAIISSINDLLSPQDPKVKDTEN